MSLPRFDELPRHTQAVVVVSLLLGTAAISAMALDQPEAALVLFGLFFVLGPIQAVLVLRAWNAHTRAEQHDD